MDPKEEARLLKIFEELEREELASQFPTEVLADEESDEDCVENDPNDEVGSELSADESSEHFTGRWSEDGPNYVGKDGKTLWKVHRSVKYTRTKRHNLIYKLPGVKPHAKNARSVYETWNMLITDRMIEDIVMYTNIYIPNIRNSYSRSRDALDTNVDEIRALFGLLYMAGVLKASHTNLADLWSTDATAPEFFRMVMSKNRCYLLLRALRFDDIRSREERKKQDKLAPIRQIFEMFQDNCEACYTPGENCTIAKCWRHFDAASVNTSQISLVNMALKFFH